uniref:Uncharacterized protein n=1 Tax=Anguilla anguilla TaxID=7936 RepID=A0A0E9T178_ANGAN
MLSTVSYTTSAFLKIFYIVCIYTAGYRSNSGYVP